MTQANKTTQQTTLMLWDGNRQLQEYTDTHTFTTVYEQNSFEPVARLIWLKEELLKAANDEIRNTPRADWEDPLPLIPNVQVFHYHNDHLGTPNELTNQEGQVVWLADYEAWGNTAKVVYTPIELTSISVSADELQPIRFQGQYIDQETGLHYNRFRYYDADVGMFISRDPIGLLGGVNVFAYAPNPTGWVDPWGLAKVPDVSLDNQGRPSQWSFDVNHSDLDTGTDTSKSTRAYARSLGGKYDDAGHVIASKLGGSGTDKANIFPQSSTINRGKMRVFEGLIAEKLANNPSLTAEATITPKYRGNSTRPSKIKYEVIFSDGSKLKKTLPNPKSKCQT